MCIMSSVIEESMKYRDTLLTLTAFESLCCFRLDPGLTYLKEITSFPQAVRTYQWLFSMQKLGQENLLNFTEYCLRNLKMVKFCMFSATILRYMLCVVTSLLVCLFSNISNLCHAILFWPRLKVCRFSSLLWGLIFLPQQCAFCSSICGSCPLSSLELSSLVHACLFSP